MLDDTRKEFRAGQVIYLKIMYIILHIFCVDVVNMEKGKPSNEGFPLEKI